MTVPDTPPTTDALEAHLIGRGREDAPEVAGTAPTTEGLEELTARELMVLVYDDTADTARRIRAAMELGELRLAFERDALAARIARLERQTREVRE